LREKVVVDKLVAFGGVLESDEVEGKGHTVKDMRQRRVRTKVRGLKTHFWKRERFKKRRSS